MITTRNPKVLNRVVMSKLNPLLEKVADLVSLSNDVQKFITEAEATEAENIARVKEIRTDYEASRQTLYDEIDNSNQKLTQMITGNLTNPNLAPNAGGGSGGTVSTETKFIKDKTVKTIGYGFVIDGIAVALAAPVGKGLAIGKDPAYNEEFEFLNPDNDGFPSYYINDILKISADRAFISTNNGIVDYNLPTKSYLTRNISNGLNATSVNSVVAVTTASSNSSSEENVSTGFIAGTEAGVSFSPNGERWVNVDPLFTKSVTCLSRTQEASTNAKQNLVFIGTPTGIYMIDVAEYLSNKVSNVVYLQDITKSLPSSYINSISYNTSSGTLCIATDGGLTVIPDFKAIKFSGEYATGNSASGSVTYTSKNGLPSTMCFDVLVQASGNNVIIGTSNGLVITNDFANFIEVTKKKTELSDGLNAYMCKKIVRKDAGTSISVIHTVGFTEGYSVK